MHGVEVLTVEVTRERSWTVHDLRAMGSPCRLMVADAPEGLWRWARHEIERLEQCWSRFRADSELSWLNASAGTPTEVSPTLMSALLRARHLHECTGGRFDPTIADALERFGYDRTFTELRPPVTEPEAVAAPGFDQVRIEADVVSAPIGVRIDLGGLGKGLAADLVVEGLLERGARSALCSMGGDIRVGGEPSEAGGWPIPIEHPDGTHWFTVGLTSGALVMTTTALRRWPLPTGTAHHLIDPSTGAPACGGVRAVVATADQAWFAEGVAKAALIAGRHGAADVLRANGVTGWLVFDDGDVMGVTR